MQLDRIGRVSNPFKLKWYRRNPHLKISLVDVFETGERVQIVPLKKRKWELGEQSIKKKGGILFTP